jgi:hypothetical protein
MRKGYKPPFAGKDLDIKMEFSLDNTMKLPI